MKGKKMNNNIRLILIASLALFLGAFIGSFTVSRASSGANIAIVDMNQVINSSSKAQALKAEQKRKFEDLISFVGKARNEMENEKDQTKVKALEKKYQDEFNAKRAVIEKDYEDKLIQINNDITKQIENIVREKNYDLVLLKSTVLSGGNDITNEVAQKIK